MSELNYPAPSNPELLESHFLLENYRTLRRSLLISQGTEFMDAHLMVSMGEMVFPDGYQEEAMIFEDFSSDMIGRIQACGYTIQQSLDIWGSLIKTHPQSTIETFQNWQNQKKSKSDSELASDQGSDLEDQESAPPSS